MKDIAKEIEEKDKRILELEEDVKVMYKEQLNAMEEEGKLFKRIEELETYIKEMDCV